MIRSSRPLVSVVIRTMPGRKNLLLRALRSVGRQTYDDVDIVVVEDGGADRAGDDFLDEAKKAAAGRAVKFVRLPKVGRCEAGNAGLAAGSGSYLNFLDDDDEFLPDHVGILVETLESHAAAPAAFSASFVSYSDIVSLDPLVIEEERRELFGRCNFSLNALWEFNCFPIQAVLFRKSTYEKFGGLTPELDAFEDWDLWLRYSAENDFLYVDRSTSRFRLPRSKTDKELRRTTHADYRSILRRRQRELLNAYMGTPFESRLQRAHDSIVSP